MQKLVSLANINSDKNFCSQNSKPFDIVQQIISNITLGSGPCGRSPGVSYKNKLVCGRELGSD